MFELTRRHLSHWTAALTWLSLLRLPISKLKAADRAPILGAIRWDAWYDPESGVGRTVIESLGPQQFHDRMPFFGREVDMSHVSIDGHDQSIFDQEIEHARMLGLNYWAYCWYEDGSSLRKAWELHQKSTHAADINWCVIWQLSHLGGYKEFSKSIPDYVRWMSQENYQKVDNSPLIYLSMDADSMLNDQWGSDLANLSLALNDFRAACQAANLKAPYLVILNSDPTKATAAMLQLKGSAISNYTGWIPQDQGAPFSKLLEFNRIFWDKMAATGSPIVPIVMTGWDTRPRKLHPPPWESKSGQQLQNTNNAYVTAGTNEEIDQAIRSAEAFVVAHPDNCPSAHVLIYSWNECDEGGGALLSKSYMRTRHHIR